MATIDFHAQLEVQDQDPLEVAAARVRESISARCHAVVEVASTHDICFDEQIGSRARLTLFAGQERTWTLRLTATRYLGDEEGSYRYLLELSDLWARQGLTRDTRKYRNLTAQQIVTQVLDECGVAHQWKLSRETRQRKYTAQYHESKLAFVERLLAYEGIYYSFDADGVLQLEDTSEAAPRVREQHYQLLEAASGMDRGDLGIHRIKRTARVCPGRVTLADYNWKRPAVLLRNTAVAPRDGDLELYEYPAGFREPDQGQELATRALEAERVRADLVEGSANDPGFAPATSIEIDTPTLPALAGTYLLLDVTHQLRNGDLPSASGLVPDGVIYESQFAAMPLAKAYRPPRVGHPMVRGTHTAMVRGPSGEEIHTDKYGRFRVQTHWDREAVGTDDDSRWVRKLQESSTSVALARVGWEMYMGYIDGDPDRPIGIGRAINGEMVPEYKQPASAARMTIKTPSSPSTGGFNELSLNDSAASQEFSVRAEKDLDNLVKNNRTETVGSNEIHTVGYDYARQISGDLTSYVGGNSTTSQGSQSNTVVGGDRTKSVGGSETVSVSGSSSWNILGVDLEIVGALRFTFSGSFEVPDFGAMAESAAEKFVSTFAPEASALYDKATSAYDKASSYLSGDTNIGDTLSSTAQSYLTNKASSIGNKAGEAMWKAFQNDASWGDIWGAGTGSLSSGLGSLGNELSSMIPSQDSLQKSLDDFSKSFDNLVPDIDNLDEALTAGASELTGGLSDSLMGGDYQLAMDQLIDLFGTGSITRSSTTVFLKMVGGGYVTVAVGPITDTVGSRGRREMIGGAKFSFSRGKMSSSVDLAQTVVVGGHASRTAAAAMRVTTVGDSSITVAANADLTSSADLTIKGSKLTITAADQLVLEGSGQTITMTPSSITIVGKLDLSGSGSISVKGHTDITP